MNVKDMHVSGVAHFEDVHLTLGSGFHLLYGPNEAGKTTLLALLIDLLFGGTPIRRDDYDSASRLAAHFEHARGVYDLRRRRYRAGLVQVDGDDKPMAEDFAASWLPVDRERYMQLYGFDHARLRSGGQSLLMSQGDLGISLFEAGSGIGNVKRLLDAYRARLAELFHPTLRSNSTAELNRALRLYQEARNDERTARLRPTAWLAQSAALAEATQQVAVLEDARKALETELRASERVKRNLANEQERLRVVAELASLGPVVELTEVAAADIERLLAEQLRLADELERETKRLAMRQDALAEVQIDADVLKSEPDIETLRDEYSLYRSTRDELVTIEQMLTARRSDWVKQRDLLIPASLRVELTVEPLAHSLTYRLEQLHEQWLDILRDLDMNDGLYVLAETDVRDKERLLPDVSDEETSSLAPLKKRIQVWRNQHISSTRSLSLAEQVRVDMAELANRLDAQPFFEGNLEKIVMTTFPLLETVGDFVARQRGLESRVADCTRELGQAEDEWNRRVAEYDAIDKAYDIPTEADLLALRRHRDEGWRHICARLAQPNQWTLEASRYVAQAGDESIEHVYERSVIDADEMADRLRREADRVAKRAEMEVGMARTEAMVVRLQLRQTTLAEERLHLQDLWLALWTDTGIHPAAPAEMQAWMQQWLQPFLRDWTICQARRQEASAAQAAVDEALSSLRDWAKTYGFSWPASLADFDDQLEWMEQEVDTREREAISHANAIASLAESRRKCQDLANQRLTLEAKRSATLAAYQELRELHPHLPSGVEELADYLQAWARLCEGLETERKEAARHRDMRNRQDQFETRVANLTKALGGMEVAASIADTSVLFSRLQARLQEAQAARREADKRRLTMEQQRQRVEEVEMDMQATQDNLNRNTAILGTTARDELMPIIRLSRRQRELVAQRQRMEQTILAAGDGYPLHVLLDELAKAGDADELALRIERLRRELGEHDAQWSSANVQLGEQKQAFLQYDGSDNRAAELAQSAFLAAEDVTMRWDEVVRTHTALVLLERALSKYRDMNQTGVLQRAAELFRRLTLERYVDLDLDDDPTAPHLLVVHRDGDKRGVGQLSDGTVDQLHFAMRLAFLQEQAAAATETMPLVMDDVFIHFDDERAQVAIEILGEIATHTQVLYFTHHRHLVEEVAKRVRVSTLQTHELRDLVRYR